MLSRNRIQGEKDQASLLPTMFNSSLRYEREEKRVYAAFTNRDWTMALSPGLFLLFC